MLMHNSFTSGSPATTINAAAGQILPDNLAAAASSLATVVISSTPAASAYLCPETPPSAGNRIASGSSRQSAAPHAWSSTIRIVSSVSSAESGLPSGLRFLRI
jgi:hypothetical protein